MLTNGNEAIGAICNYAILWPGLTFTGIFLCYVSSSMNNNYKKNICHSFYIKSIINNTSPLFQHAWQLATLLVCDVIHKSII
jgi:hypothetical protein